MTDEQDTRPRPGPRRRRAGRDGRVLVTGGGRGRHRGPSRLSGPPRTRLSASTVTAGRPGSVDGAASLPRRRPATAPLPFPSFTQSDLLRGEARAGRRQSGERTEGGVWRSRDGKRQSQESGGIRNADKATFKRYPRHASKAHLILS